MAGSGNHDARQLARFQDGESRLVYARYRAEPDRVFLLGDGQAAELRAFTRDELECLVDGCTDRRLRAVSRWPKRRDGFSHLPGGGGHAPESLHHLQGKLRVLEWVRAKHPQLLVTTEQPLEGGQRIPDVLITSDQDPSRRLAIEVQYAALRDHEWVARHEWYGRVGIGDCWLLGHTGPHMRTVGEGQVVLNDLHRAILRAGLPLLWINPMEGEVATAKVRLNQRQCSRGCRHGVAPDWILPGPDDRRIDLEVHPLSECKLAYGVFTTPTMSRLAEATRRWEEQRDSSHAAMDARDAQHAAAWQAERFAARRTAEGRALQLSNEARFGAADRAREASRFKDWWDAHGERVADEWLRSDLRRELVHRHRGTMPAWIVDTVTCEDGVAAHPEYWRALLWFHHLYYKPNGHVVTHRACLRTLQREGIQIQKQRGTTAIDRWLRALVEADLLHQEGKRLLVGPAPPEPPRLPPRLWIP